MMVSAVVLPLLALLNWALYSATSASTRSLLVDAPQLEKSLLARDAVQFYVVLVGSVLFLVGVFVFSILETHRTAGAELSLARRLQEIEEGRYRVTAKLRRGDNLGSLERSFNRMVESLVGRTRNEIDELERIAAELEASADEPARRRLAGRLRELARLHRDTVE